MISQERMSILHPPSPPTKIRRGSNQQPDSPTQRPIKYIDPKLSYKGKLLVNGGGQTQQRKMLGGSKDYKTLQLSQLFKGKKLKVAFDATTIQQTEDVNCEQVIGNLHPISYSPRSRGWKDIYLGMMSPHAQQYDRFVKPVLQKLQKAKKEEEKHNNENKFMDVLNKLKERTSKSQKKLHLLKVLKDDRVDENFDEKDIQRFYEDLSNNRLTIKSQHLLSTFKKSKLKIPMPQIPQVTKRDSENCNHFTVNCEKLSDKTMMSREQRKSMHIEPKFQNNNYFVDLIMNSYAIKKQMINDFKVRRKSCQCQGCCNVTLKKKELKDPLAQYLTLEELFNKRDILQKFKENVILALQQKRQKDAEDEAQVSRQKIMGNALMKRKTLNLLAVKKRKERLRKWRQDSLKNSSQSPSSNKSKNETTLGQDKKPYLKSKFTQRQPQIRVSDQEYIVDVQKQTKTINPFLMLAKNFMMTKKYGVDGHEDLLKRSNTLMDLTKIKNNLRSKDSFSEDSESIHNKVIKEELPKQQSQLYNVLFRKGSQPSLLFTQTVNTRNNCFFSKRYSTDTGAARATSQSQSQSVLNENQMKSVEWLVDLKKSKPNLQIGKQSPYFSKIQILTKLKQSIDNSNRMMRS